MIRNNVIRKEDNNKLNKNMDNRKSKISNRINMCKLNNKYQLSNIEKYEKNIKKMYSRDDIRNYKSRKYKKKQESV